jgi:hypothetical protein
MARSLAPLEVNSFVAGLVSDASPLTFPENASLAEDNMVLNSDGSRNRRLGMDFEPDSTEVESQLLVEPSSYVHSSFSWKNAGGNPNKTLLVVQFGGHLDIFDLGSTPISDGKLASFEMATGAGIDQFSYATVDGILVVATGKKAIDVLEYKNGAIERSSGRIKVRDLFGVEDVVDGKDLFDDNNVTLRIETAHKPHIYNLRNQSYGIPRMVRYTADAPTDPRDPIKGFFDNNGKYPSNSDFVGAALYADANLSNNRTADRYHVKDAFTNPIGSTKAPSGYFIIDALDRGTSRYKALSDNNEQYHMLETYGITAGDLPLDSTGAGAKTVVQFSGRVWFGGFSGPVTGGDRLSPNLSSYVMFSRLVNTATDIFKCYQQGDPTSKDEPDLLPTDGGFIKIDEAYNIKRLEVSGNNLFVFAENGVWRVYGGTAESGFSATEYSVSKVTTSGCVGTSTVVNAEGVLYYWGVDGIYNLAQNQFGEWGANNIAINRIQEFYNNIPSTDKVDAQVGFDPYEKKVKWIYRTTDKFSDTQELVLDTTLGSFYTNTIFSVTQDKHLPKIVGIFEGNPFSTVIGDEPVFVGLDEVLVGAESVFVETSSRGDAPKSLFYIAVTDSAGPVKYRFCAYLNQSFKDWQAYDGNGVDAAAYMVTGYISGGDFQRVKQLPYLTIYLNKTERGFLLDQEGDYKPINPSSCIVQVHWGWTNSPNANRWTNKFQAYRHRRHYFPTGQSDQFNDGNEVVVTKNKVRGKGRVMSIRFETEPEKDLQLLGWSMIAGIMTDV